MTSLWDGSNSRLSDGALKSCATTYGGGVIAFTSNPKPKRQNPMHISLHTNGNSRIDELHGHH